MAPTSTTRGRTSITFPSWMMISSSQLHTSSSFQPESLIANPDAGSEFEWTLTDNNNGVTITGTNDTPDITVVDATGDISEDDLGFTFHQLHRNRRDTSWPYSCI